jgi:hypothetical protein
MSTAIGRLGRAAAVSALTAIAASQANARNLTPNVAFHGPAQSNTQSIDATGGRQPGLGYGTSNTAPPYYGGGGPQRHLFDPNTQFSNATNNSTNGLFFKKPK